MERTLMTSAMLISIFENFLSLNRDFFNLSIEKTGFFHRKTSLFPDDYVKSDASDVNMNLC